MRALAPALVALFLAVGHVPASAQSAMPIVREGETLILTEAVGTVQVIPDYLTIETGVITRGPSAAEALDANNRKMTEVLLAVREAGIEPSEVQTESLSVDPIFEDGEDGPDGRIIAYEAENTVIIELRDVTSAGLTISTLFDAGANKVEGPRFNIDEATYQRAASEGERLALEDARRQAENLAGALGMRVSRVLRVSNREIDFNREYGVRRGGGLIVVTGSRVTTSPTPLEPGEIDFEVELFVEFALVPT